MIRKGNLRELKMYRLFLPYDVYERHRKVGSLIEKDQTVLDVGGELNSLTQFCSPKKIVVSNLASAKEKSDVIIRREELPFPKDSFDIVCAIDVLEHVQKDKREEFINKLMKVAQKRVILSFPLGTKEHISLEKEIKDLLLKKGMNVDYLNEHIRYGLPTPEEIAKFKKIENLEVFYSGDIKLNKYLFRVFLFDPKIKYLGKIIYYLKFLLNFFSNPVLYTFLSNRSFSEVVNRAYLIIEKK